MSAAQPAILIVEDDPGVALAAELVLRQRHSALTIETNPAKLEQLLKRARFDVVLLDMNFSPGQTNGKEGLYWLQRIKASAPLTQVIMITAYADIQLAVKAIKQGAADFLTKPWANENLLQCVAEAAAQARAAPATSLPLGTSRAYQEVLEVADKVAATDAAVLLLGENGTGKGVLARYIHSRSGRADRTFVEVDLGAIPEALFESEMFGHKAGAYTDAKADRKGRFEIASGGTLFLDEISNLSAPCQGKLLGALQSQRINRVGSDQPVAVNARLISASNLQPQELADPTVFRRDLYYRINTVELTIPPLRQRPEDIGLLAEHFLQLYASQYDKSGLSFAPAAASALRQHSWPGNVRELQHTLERAVIVCSPPLVQTSDLFPNVQAGMAAAANSTLINLEMEAIRAAIADHDGNLTHVARSLGISRSTLYRKIEKYGL